MLYAQYDTINSFTRGKDEILVILQNFMNSYFYITFNVFLWFLNYWLGQIKFIELGFHSM